MISTLTHSKLATALLLAATVAIGTGCKPANQSQANRDAAATGSTTPMPSTGTTDNTGSAAASAASR